MKTSISKFVPHMAALVVILLLNAVYLSPQLTDNALLQAGDLVSHKAMNQHVAEHKESTGEWSNWNPAMFSGMPWRMLSVGSDKNLLHPTYRFFYTGKAFGIFVKVALFCYLALVLLGVNPWLSLLGALILGLNINHTVLVEAGHMSKMDVIANFPLLLAGIIMCLNKRYLTGGIVVAFASSLAILGNHIQMVYYFAILMAVVWLGYLIYFIQKKDIQPLIKGTLVIAAAASIALLSNFTPLASTFEYSKSTMRGQPILASNKSNEEAKSSSVTDGLAWNYAMSWSNGVGDIVSTVIPRAVGGSSAEEIPANSRLGDLLVKNGQRPDKDDNINRAPLYWGSMIFTAGPYYVGMAALLLFFLFLFNGDPRLKWGMAAAVVLLLLLSMGKNAAFLNRVLFDHLPFFNKFRSPNSIMNILPSLMIIPVILGLSEFLKHAKVKPAKTKHLLYITGGLVGLCLLYTFLGTASSSFLRASDATYDASVQAIFKETRRSLLYSDTWRSIGFCIVIAGLMLAYAKHYIKSPYILVGAIGLISLFDLWSVNRRYLDEDTWAKSSSYEASFNPRPIDQQIFQAEPKGRGYYRVLDQSINTFNSAQTSYHHNTIGGYHPAKLQRYQDMIDYHIGKGNMDVLNMLNSKYFITKDQQLQVNNRALGNAWFVKDIREVNTPNEEISAMNNFNPTETAIVLASEFTEEMKNVQLGDGSGSIELVQYEPNKLVYKTNTTMDQLAVFSEVWYGSDRGWRVRIDGDEFNNSILRANYILRALPVPAGTHEIEFYFEPESKGNSISFIASLLIILGVVFLLYKSWKSKEPLYVPLEVEAPKSSAMATSPKATRVPTKKAKKSTKGKRNRE